MSNNALDVYDTLEDRSTMIQVSQDLMSAVTRIVIIVDAIVCDHFLLSKSKVSTIFPSCRCRGLIYTISLDFFYIPLVIRRLFTTTKYGSRCRKHLAN